MPPEDPVHEPRTLVGRVALGEADRLVDRDLGRHLAAVELADRDAQRAPLDGAEPVGASSPRTAAVMRASSSGACATVSSASSRAHGSISPAYCEPISAPGDVPLVDEEERLAACLAARGHASSPTAISTVGSIPHIVLERRGDLAPARARPARASGSPRRSATVRRTTPPSRSIVRRRRTRIAVDALGGAHGDPDERPRRARSPCRALVRHDRAHAATAPQLGERRGRVVAAAELRAARGSRARARASSGRPRRRAPSSARSARAIAAGRSASQTTSFAISES